MLAGAGAEQHLRVEAGVHSQVVVVGRAVDQLVDPPAGNTERTPVLATS